VAVAGAVFATFGGAAAGSALATPHAHVVTAGEAGQRAFEVATFLRGFHAALLTCAAFAMLGALIALLRGRERSPHSGPLARGTVPPAAPSPELPVRA
jgi:hypothetical protein